MEGTLGGRYSYLLLTAGPGVRSDQVAQGLIQLGLESLQGWRLHGLKELIQYLAVLMGNEFLLISSLNLLFQYMSLLALVLVPCTAMKILVLSSL